MTGQASISDVRPVTVIDAAVYQQPSSLFEIWEYRDLLALFIMREIKLRYQQTAVGLAWVLLQPLLIMLVLSGFASLMGVRTGRIPYPLLTISGLIPWIYFTHAFTKTTFSLVSQSEIMGKIYFPRLIVPIAAAAGGAADFFVAALLLPLFMLHYGARPAITLAAIPLFVAMALAAALGLGLWLSVLNVRYRDVGNTLPFITQVLFFATPVAFSADLVPEPWRTLAGLNPMFGVVEGFRWALLGGQAGGMHQSIAVSGAVSVALLLGGVRFFRRQEAIFIDRM